jgi:hypothetical protein
VKPKSDEDKVVNEFSLRKPFHNQLFFSEKFQICRDLAYYNKLIPLIMFSKRNVFGSIGYDA